LQNLQNVDERTQGTHLPQEKKMEVPQVRQGQDARAKISLETTAARRSQLAPVASAIIGSDFFGSVVLPWFGRCHDVLDSQRRSVTPAAIEGATFKV